MPTVNKLRRIPGKLGFRQYQVDLVIRTGGDFSRGIPFDSETVTPITVSDGYAPRVRWVTQSDYARGMDLNCVLEVGSITPEFDINGVQGGYSYETLEGTDAPKGSHIFYRVRGSGFPEEGGFFQKISFSGNRSLGFFIQLKRAPSELL